MGLAFFIAARRRAAENARAVEKAALADEAVAAEKRYADGVGLASEKANTQPDTTEDLTEKRAATKKTKSRK